MKLKKLSHFWILLILAIPLYVLANSEKNLIEKVLGFVSAVIISLFLNELKKRIDRKSLPLAQANDITGRRLLRYPLSLKKEVETYSSTLEPHLKKRTIGKNGQPNLLSRDLDYSSLFDELRVNKITAITGDSGIGKSALLKKLVVDFACEADKDNSRPIPLLLDCASWKANYRGLGEWIVQQVKKIPDTAGEAKDAILGLIANGNFILFLDGFDEIQDKYREDFISSLREFHDSSSAGIIISSRPLAYEKYFNELKVDSIYMLVGLEPNQILANLTGKQEFEDFRKNYYSDGYESLRELIKTPLMLKMFIRTAPNIGFDILSNGSTKELKTIIILCYVQKALARKPKIPLSQQPDPQQVDLQQNDSQNRVELLWLQNLAKGMIYPVFWLEDIQHRWLKINPSVSWFNRLRLELFSFLCHISAVTLSFTLVLLLYKVKIVFACNLITASYLFILVGGFFWSRKTLKTTKKPNEKGFDSIIGFNSIIPEEIDFMKKHRFKMPDFKSEFKAGWKTHFGKGKNHQLGLFVWVIILTLLFMKAYHLSLAYTTAIGVGIYFFPILKDGCYGSLKDMLSPVMKKRINYEDGVIFEKCGIDSTIKTIIWYTAIFITPLTFIMVSLFVAIGRLFFTDRLVHRTVLENTVNFSYAVSIFWLIIIMMFYRDIGVMNLIRHYYLRVCLHLQGTIPSMRMKRFCDDMVDKSILKPAPGGWRFYHQEIQEVLADQVDKQT